MPGESRPPLPPFTHETAIIKVRAAEDGWNGRNAEKVALAYTEDSVWRNRAEFLQGRAAIAAYRALCHWRTCCSEGFGSAVTTASCSQGVEESGT